MENESPGKSLFRRNYFFLRILGRALDAEPLLQVWPWARGWMLVGCPVPPNYPLGLGQIGMTVHVSLSPPAINWDVYIYIYIWSHPPPLTTSELACKK